MTNENKKIVGEYKIYTSVLYKNWFAVEFIEQKGAQQFRIRLPYNTRCRAEQMLNHLRENVGSALVPDYRPHIHMIEKGIVR